MNRVEESFYITSERNARYPKLEEILLLVLTVEHIDNYLEILKKFGDIRVVDLNEFAEDVVWDATRKARKLGVLVVQSDYSAILMRSNAKLSVDDYTHLVYIALLTFCRKADLAYRIANFQANNVNELEECGRLVKRKLEYYENKNNSRHVYRRSEVLMTISPGLTT